MIEHADLIATGLFPIVVIDILLIAGPLGFMINFFRKNL